jgi:hypothetical protein
MNKEKAVLILFMFLPIYLLCECWQQYNYYGHLSESATLVMRIAITHLILSIVGLW